MALTRPNIRYADMPSGSILQLVHDTSGEGSEITASSNSWVSGGSDSTVTITPKFSGSKLVVMAVFNIDTANSNSRAMYTLFKSVNGGTFTNVASTFSNNNDSFVRVHELGERILANQTIIFHDTASSTQSHAYRLYVRNQLANETARIRNDLAPCHLVIYEVAA